LICNKKNRRQIPTTGGAKKAKLILPDVMTGCCLSCK
jgi:hypothetical protein